MRLYHDQDADLNLLAGRRIAVIGYGNQGRAQALNLRDSSQDVIIGNREDGYAEQARSDGFAVLPIAWAVEQASVVMMLIPDEVMPEGFESEITPHLHEGNVLVFASGYTITFGLLAPPAGVDVVLVAPRMIGAGVRDLYLAGHGFPSFIGVAQDHSGQAKEMALALAKGIGSTRAGVVEVTFAQETELDLFTEQCFGPAFGQVLMTAVNLLLAEGYPPEAVLLELYMSGEFAYTLYKIAELGMVEQTALHSRTSQYGSMSRGMRFMIPDLQTTMQEGLQEIRSGAFAQEWAAEQAAGSPTLESLKEAARSLPLYELERELRQALGNSAYLRQPGPGDLPTLASATPAQQRSEGLLSRGMARLRRLRRRREIKEKAQPTADPLSEAEMERVLRAFLANTEADAALQAFAGGRQLTVQYQLSDMDLQFCMGFDDGSVTGRLDAPQSDAQVLLTMTAELLDGMLTGRTNAARAAMAGKLSFGGDTRRAMALQQIQADLVRLYTRARQDALGE